MKRLQAILVCSLIAGVWNVTAVTSAAPASADPTPMEKVEAVQAEYDDTMGRWEKLYKAGWK